MRYQTNKQMNTYNFTDGKKELKLYKEISNIDQGVYGKNEVIRTFRTDELNDIHKSDQYSTRFE